MNSVLRRYADKPLVAMADLVDEMTEASRGLGLATLKAEMEGLALLFGGSPAPLTEAEQRAGQAETEAAFDNLPV